MARIELVRKIALVLLQIIQQNAKQEMTAPRKIAEKKTFYRFYSLFFVNFEMHKNVFTHLLKLLAHFCISFASKNSQMRYGIRQRICPHSTMPHENSTEPKMFHEILAYRRIIRIEVAWATKRSPVQPVLSKVYLVRLVQVSFFYSGFWVSKNIYLFIWCRFLLLRRYPGIGSSRQSE